MRRISIVMMMLVIVLMAAPVSRVEARTLPIPPVAQNLSAWCWLAVGEMVFRYHRVPNINPAGVYQCGIAAAVFGGICMNDCRQCNAGSGPAHVLRDMLVYYPQFVRNVAHRQSPALTADVSTSALSEDEVKSEIDAERPVVAGISPNSGLLPPGLSEHAVLIVGYEEQGDTLFLIVNDPFPYAQAGMRDPYTTQRGTRLTNGRYRIRYETMTDALAWGNTIYGIERE